jgi:aspartate aminotransferase-like enzyme
MSQSRHLTFKVASEPWEMEAIHRLNHRTFAEEIPQHDGNDEGRLVDRFHDENIYIICLAGQELAGMIALRRQRPFSLDSKIPDLESHLPAGHQWCEVRLLAVDRRFRNTAVTVGLLQLLSREAVSRGCNAAVISATTRQLKLYRHMGCVPFGPLVGREGAWYQPMYLSMENVQAGAPVILDQIEPPVVSAPPPGEPLNFLPGPVAIPRPVRDAFVQPPVSHRAVPFIEDVQMLRRRLCELTGAHYAQVMLGSGTLANEIVAAQISRLDAPGLVVSNGEFGERLADHARRLWLPHEHLCLPWGHMLDTYKLGRLLDRHPEVRWLWTTHCETSTSALNDLHGLVGLCAQRDIRLAVDAVSTVGVVPVDLSGVWMASCASGKGLASYPGLAIVLHNDPVDPAPDKLPRYLDLGLYSCGDGVPFTQSSNLISALKTSLEITDWHRKMERVRTWHDRIRERLQDLGAVFIGNVDHSSPAVITLAMKDGVNSLEVADRLEAAGFLLSCRSAYLSTRNWLQIVLMGDLTDNEVETLLSHLEANNPWQA